MFLILLTYIQPLEQVDQFLSAHRAFLEKHYGCGHFLLSGRLEPRTGGLILARASQRAELESWLKEDPFQQAGLAQYQILEFTPTMAAEPMQELLHP